MPLVVESQDTYFRSTSAVNAVLMLGRRIGWGEMAVSSVDAESIQVDTPDDVAVWAR